MTLTLFKVPVPVLPSRMVTIETPPELIVAGENDLAAVSAEL